MRDLLARIAGRAVERPTPVIAAAVLLTLIGAAAALSLEPARSPDSLVDRRSGTYAATQSFYDQFGGEPVEVLVKGDVQELLLSDNLGRLLALESCLSGRAKGGKVIGGQPAPPACAAIARLDPSFAVFGPGDLPEPVRDRGPKPVHAAVQLGPPGGSTGGAEGGARGATERALAGAAATGRAGGGPAGPWPLPAAARWPGGPLRPDGVAEDRRPAVRPGGDLRHVAAGVRRPSRSSRRSFPAPMRR